MQNKNRCFSQAMTKILIFAGILFSNCEIFAQQTINSKGNNNINVNGNVVVVIRPEVSPLTQKDLEVVTKRALGEKEHWEGVLVPASEKVPMLGCHSLGASLGAPSPHFGMSEKDTITIRAGKNDFECGRATCNVLRAANKNLIWISRKNGLLMVEARILKGDGIIIASIENNQFFVNRNQTYRPPLRADASSLEVFDERGEVVLKLRFVNRKMLVIEGVFNDGNGHKLTIDSNGISGVNNFKHFETSGNCFINPPNGNISALGDSIGDFIFGGDLPYQKK
jgi:hypothetical protein